MSECVLTGPFLDFGKSLWGTQLMVSELPSLASTGFESTGHYGIGFFSVFMLGKRVRVITRRFDEAMRETRVLEFLAGVGERPLLRQAIQAEQIRDGGTVVRVWLKDNPTKEGGLQWLADKRGTGEAVSLSKLVSWIAPAVDINIRVQDKGISILFKANDWVTNKGKKFFERIWPLEHFRWSLEGKLGAIVREVRHNGKTVGRGCILPPDVSSRLQTQGTITVGGFRAAGLSGIAGIFLGRSLKASRDSAELLLPLSALAEWANEQATLVRESFSDPEELADCAVTIELCGGDPGELPIIKWRKKWLTANELATLVNIPKSIAVIDTVDFKDLSKRYSGIKLNKNVMIQPVSSAMSIYADDETKNFGSIRQQVGARSEFALDTIIKRALRKAWNVPAIGLRSIDDAIIGRSSAGDVICDVQQYSQDVTDDDKR